MKIRYLHIKNFRSCKDVHIEFESMHSLVGANNAGKSTILRALDFFFNPSLSKIDEESFWNNDSTQTIWIEVVFDNLTGEEIEKLKPYLRSDNTFHVARSAKATVETENTERSGVIEESKFTISQHYCKPAPKLDWLNQSKISGSAIEEWWQHKDNLTSNGNRFVDFIGTVRPNVTTWKQKAEEFARRFLTSTDYQEFWTENPAGYANVLKGTLPHFVLVPAVRNVTDEAKATKTNPLGRLLYAVIDTVTDAQRDTLATSLKEMQRKLNRQGGIDRLPAITQTEKRLNDILKEYMDCDLEIEFQTPSLEVVLTSPRIFADDGFRNVVENKGHGLQRAIIFSIIRCYSELITGKGEQKKRTMILAVEEPELYMHPHAQRTIRQVFLNICKGGDQVVFSTHSSLLLDVSDFDQIIRVEALQTNAEGKRMVESQTWRLPMSAMIQDINSRHPTVSATAESIRELYANAYNPLRSEGFFARKVILVEGATEQYSLPIYAEAAGFPLDSLNISVVSCGGKGPMDRLYRIFNELGIACYLLFDYDKDNKDKDIITKSRDLLQLCGLPPNVPDRVLISQNLACFPNKWETDLAAEIPDLPNLIEDARRKLGLSGDSGKPLVARYVARILTSKEPKIVPSSIRLILQKAVAVSWTKSCLVK